MNHPFCLSSAAAIACALSVSAVDASGRDSLTDRSVGANVFRSERRAAARNDGHAARTGHSRLEYAAPMERGPFDTPDTRPLRVTGDALVVPTPSVEHGPILHCRRPESRSARAGVTVLVVRCLDMHSARRTGMNTCARTDRGLLVVAVRMRRSGRTTRRAVRMGRRIRSILRCRSRKRGRFMTTARGRSARRRAVRGRRGRLAISGGEARGSTSVVALNAGMAIDQCLASIAKWT